MNKDQGLGYRVASQHNKKRKNMFSLILTAACRYEFFLSEEHSLPITW
jgi:hypothetical protein